MRKFSHITLKYIFNRLSEIIYQRKNPCNPWLTSNSVEILSKILNKDDIGLEFGSGKSTIWIAKRIKFLHSIEYKDEWYEIILNTIKKKKLKNKVNIKLMNKKKDYIQIINNFKNESLDFCLVDSIWRDHAALHVLPKLKKGGILVLDNANWYLPSNSMSPNSIKIYQKHWSKTFAKFHKKVKNWRNIWTTNGVSDTSLWIKK